MAGYRRIKNAVAAENGKTSIIIGQEGLKVPSADAEPCGRVEREAHGWPQRQTGPQ